jgi:VWFA-related protein
VKTDQTLFRFNVKMGDGLMADRNGRVSGKVYNRTLRKGASLMHSYRFIRGIVLICLPLVTATLQAQGSGVPESQTVIHAQTNLVLVDVVVTDHGKPLNGLDQSKFRIFEDDKQQPISSFDEHRPSSTTADTIKAPQLPPNTYTNLPAYPTQSAVNVLLIDALNTPMGDQLRVRQQMIQYLKKVPPGTMLAVFTLTTRLRMISGFTEDAASLSTIMTAKKSTIQPSSLMATAGADNPASEATSALPISPAPPPTSGNLGSGGVTSAPMGAAAALAQFQSDVIAGQADIRLRVTLDAMQQLAAYLNGIPGRKNLIWLSGSFPFTILPDSSQYSPFRNVTNYRDRIEKTTNMLTAARVSVYPVDARGLQVATMSPTGGSTFSAGMRGVPDTSGSQSVAEQRTADEATMSEVADQTGGRAYFEANDLSGAIENAVESGENYYTIGYVPSGAKMNGSFRKIKVSVDAPDVKLFYRRGYYADAPDKQPAHGSGPFDPRVAASLLGAPPATEIVFEAALLAGNDPMLNNVRLPGGKAGEMSDKLSKPTRYVVDLTLNPKSLNLSELPDGTRQAKIDLILIAYNGNGELANYVDHAAQIGIKKEQYQHVVEQGLPLLIPIDLPAGGDWLRVAVEDLNTGRTGSLEIPVTVPDS